MSDAQREDDGFNWFVQVGPNLQGETGGVVNGVAATFLLATGGEPDPVSAVCSTTAGSSWIDIPPNQPFSVSGSNRVQWRLYAPQDSDGKFLIGAA